MSRIALPWGRKDSGQVNTCSIRVLPFVIFGLSAPARVHADPPIAALLKLHTQEAKSYQIFQDEQHKQPLELVEKPVFNWTNVIGEDTQYGHLFVWSRAGRPEVIGTMFSTRDSDPRRRKLIHEFHSLSTSKLYPVTPEASAYRWTPERGITLVECDEAPAVADSAPQRLVQIRQIARSFAAESLTREGQTWELRLLPTPLLRYESKATDIPDGALFAMVSSAGTDPELLLLIEARRPRGDEQTWKWHAAALRFSDKDLTVKRNGKPFWSSREDPSRHAAINADYTLIETPDKTYMCYRARLIDELPD
jgi:hypothetical protein